MTFKSSVPQHIVSSK